jgi:hypothetical protein
MDQIAYLQFPKVSGIGIQTAEFFGQKANDVAGFGMQQAQPRVAAAGVMADAQEIDQRLDSYVDACENEFLIKAAWMIHQFNRQFMTEERKVKTLGGRGLGAQDIRTVRPTDLGVDILFEATAGRRISQKAFMSQQLVNLLDRAAPLNMMSNQMGRGDIIDIPQLLRTIYGDTFGIQGFNQIIRDAANPEDMRTAGQEHYLYSLGERPGIQKGENTFMHLQEHLMFAKAGGWKSWRKEDQRAFFDHYYDTVDAFHRLMEAYGPSVQMIIQSMMAEMQALGGSGPSSRSGPASGGAGGQSGGRGFSPAGSQSPGSPQVRPLTMPGMGGGTQPLGGASMGRTANMGAA